MEGVSMPLGIAVLDWASSRLLSCMAEVLLREVLGLNTIFTGPFLSTVTATYELVGCTDPTAIGGPLERGCSPTNSVSRSHVTLESWDSAITPFFYKELSKVIGEATLPIDLGSVGYDGYEGLYVPTKPRLAALESAGLPLEYYRSYNSSWHNASIYFDKYSDIPTDGLVKCSESKFAVDWLNANYVKITNDTDGVEVVNGRLVAKCLGGLDGHWWFAPACRDKPETCIPLIDSGDGWSTDVSMQRAAVFNMPVALAVGTWSKYCEEPSKRDMLFYWWSPDTAFINLRPTPVMFPPPDKAEWEAGRKTTDSQKVALKTRVHYAIPDVASRASELVGNIQLTAAQLEALLIATTENASKTEAEIACDWLKANREIWSSWVPFETKCARGWGLISSTGEFVADRAHASRCEWCPPGTYSSKSYDGMGPTAVCTPCERGTFQPSPGQSVCLSCEPGKFTGVEGESVCEACPIGTYAEGAGSPNCTTCGGGAKLWTTMRKLTVRGVEQWVTTDSAASQELCGCDVGARFDAAGACVECQTEGLECLGMSEVVISPGFYSPSVLSVFKCGTSVNCKGGVPGETCAEGREGVACALCKPGLRSTDGGACVPCTGRDKVPFAMLVCATLLVCFIAYWLIDRGAGGQPSHAALVLGVSGGLVVALMQQLSVVSMLDLTYMEPLSGFLKIVHMSTFSVEEIIHVNCLGQMSAVSHFTTKVCLIFAACLIVVIIHTGFVIVKYQRRFRERTPTLVSAFGTAAMVFYISVTVTILEPFQCNQNPNGKWTTQAYEDVICWARSEHSDHEIMVGVSLVALVMPILLFARVFQLVRKFPRALKAGNTGFMRSYGFLFCRFRPQAHWYIMIIMSRSLFVAVVPIIPKGIAQIYALQVALLVCFATCVYYQPWRAPSLNFADGLIGAMMILFMQMTSFCVKLTSFEILGWVNVAMVIVALAFLLTVVVLAVLRRCGKLTKPFRFFLCHVKSESGAFARWLKLELVSNPQVKQEVFLDADNLESLTCLLDYVASGVSTVVVIGTKSIFYRPWCVGEMTTAHISSVDSTVLEMPDFQALSFEVIARYETEVPDLERLCVDNGISLEDVRQALTELSQRQRICVPTTSTGPGMALLGRMLIAGMDSISPAIPTKAASTWPEVGIVRDATVEANAIAFVLQRCLVRFTCFADNGPPEVLCLEKDEDLPKLKKAILVCTHGCFAELEYLNRVCELSDAGTPVLPVIGDDEFRVPRQDMFSTIPAAKLRPSAGGGIRSAEMVARMVANILQEIAPPFRAKTERYVALETAAATVAKRLTEPQYRLDCIRVGLGEKASWHDETGSADANQSDGAGTHTLDSFEDIGDELNMDMEGRKRPIEGQLSEYMVGFERVIV